jgi:hypothetical protein
MRCNVTAATSGINITVVAAATVVGRFYAKFAATPSATVNLATLVTGSDAAAIQAASTGKWRARAGPSGAETLGPDIVNGQWHRVDFRFSGLSGTAWVVDWQIDGVAQTQETGTASGASTDVTLTIGIGSTATCDVSIDDLIISETSGDYPIGPGRVVGISPSGAADHQSITTTQWQTTSDFSAFTDFTGQTESVSAPLIDDLTAGTDGIRMNGGAGGQAGNARWSFADPSPDPGLAPNGVRGIVVHQDASSGTNNITERILLSASTANIFSGNPAAAWEYRAATFALDPGTGAWSAQDIRDLQFEIDSTDTNPAVWFGGVVCEVDYPARDSLVVDYDPYLMHSLVR